MWLPGASWTHLVGHRLDRGSVCLAEGFSDVEETSMGTYQRIQRMVSFTRDLEQMLCSRFFTSLSCNSTWCSLRQGLHIGPPFDIAGDGVPLDDGVAQHTQKRLRTDSLAKMKLGGHDWINT